MHLACISRASRTHLACISRASRAHLACISHASRMHLACISRASRVRLACISHASRVHLACISARLLGAKEELDKGVGAVLPVQQPLLPARVKGGAGPRVRVRLRVR
eukprot:scaffold109997_cov33-Phaeocystis_antarctica.AAC.1